jgi:hypothetical protein
MAGLLTHLTIALVGFLIGTFIFKNWRYGLAFAIGHLIPDLLDFGIAGIKQGSLNPGVIMTNPLFQPLALFGHTFWHWIIFGLIVCFAILWLYNKNKISNKTFKTWFTVLIFFLIGVAIHVLIIDILIIETSYWI